MLGVVVLAPGMPQGTMGGPKAGPEEVAEAETWFSFTARDHGTCSSGVEGSKA